MSKLILFNKPFHVLSQFTDQAQRTNLSDYINVKGFYAAGRLDYDSEGLLILTNDGKLQHRIAHPTLKLFKTYYIQVEGTITDIAINKLRDGITLKDGLTKPAKAKELDEPAIWDRTPPIRERKNKPTSWIELSICEGRNRQIRRMTAAAGFPTLRLIRTKIGEWELENLKPGEWYQI